MQIDDRGGKLRWGAEECQSRPCRRAECGRTFENAGSNADLLGRGEHPSALRGDR
jgi:hypothetical protein